MTMLEVEHLSKSFGGVHAVQDVSFSIGRGIVQSVIGPNDAGKTTLFNLITGLYTPTGGSIRFETREIGGGPADELARLGMSRTFQNLQVCMNLSALDNVLVGAHPTLDGSVLSALWRSPA